MTFAHSITFRFTLWYLLVLAVLLFLLSIGTYFNLSRTLNANLDQTLRARAEQLIAFRDIAGIIERGQFEENIGELVSIFSEQQGRPARVSTRTGSIPLPRDLVEQVIGGDAFFLTLVTEKGQSLRVFATPYFNFTAPPRRDQTERGIPDNRPPRLEERNRDRPQPAALVVSRDTSSIEEALDALVRTLLIAVPLTLLIAGGGGIFLARRVLTPVDHITRAARRIEESDLSKRIPVTTSDELGRLAATLNQMIERLERAFKRQKQFTGDASHELRTPLAVIEAESTLSLKRERSLEEYQRSLGVIAEEANHMASIIDQLLNLARADAGKEQLEFSPVQLDECLRRICATHENACQAKEIELSVHIVSPTTVQGNAAMLTLLFTNLITNAIKYTPNGGKITCLIHREGKTAIVAISDTGIGIPAKDLPLIFDRFYRVDKARSRAEGGSGLGLAICKQIVELHSGSIMVESAPGQGSTFTVKFC